MPAMQVSTDSQVLGAAVGAVVCAIVRGGFTAYNLESATTESAASFARGTLGFFALAPSIGIGALCGAIAGATCDRSLGAVVGAALSAGILLLFLLPFGACIGMFETFFGTTDMGESLEAFTAIYFVQKGIAGAIGGAAGGFAGEIYTARHDSNSDSESTTTPEPQRESEPKQDAPDAKPKPPVEP